MVKQSPKILASDDKTTIIVATVFCFVLYFVCAIVLNDRGIPVEPVEIGSSSTEKDCRSDYRKYLPGQVIRLRLK